MRMSVVKHIMWYRTSLISMMRLYMHIGPCSQVYPSSLIPASSIVSQCHRAAVLTSRGFILYCHLDYTHHWTRTVVHIASLAWIYRFSYLMDYRHDGPVRCFRLQTRIIILVIRAYSIITPTSRTTKMKSRSREETCWVTRWLDRWSSKQIGFKLTSK